MASINAWLEADNITRSDESCPGGGKYSALVSDNGNYLSHLDLSQSKRDRYLTIRFWAKAQGTGGVVFFSILGTQQEEIWINIHDTSWFYYQASDTLFCPALHTPRITMFAGGFLYGRMLVDLMEVEKIR